VTDLRPRLQSDKAAEAEAKAKAAKEAERK
jgi:hypothetical protein